MWLAFSSRYINLCSEKKKCNFGVAATLFSILYEVNLKVHLCFWWQLKSFFFFYISCTIKLLNELSIFLIYLSMLIKLKSFSRFSSLIWTIIPLPTLFRLDQGRARKIFCFMYNIAQLNDCNYKKTFMHIPNSHQKTFYIIVKTQLA